MNMDTFLEFKRRLLVAFMAMDDMAGDHEIRAQQVIMYLNVKEAERLCILLEKVVDKWEEEYGEASKY